jgi:hypothetical protein
MPKVKPDSVETRALLEQVQQGDRQAIDRLLALEMTGTGPSVA